MLKSPVILTNVFYGNYLSMRNVATSGLSEDSAEINHCFLNIEKMFEEVLKTIFDDSIYPSVQEKCI